MSNEKEIGISTAEMVQAAESWARSLRAAAGAEKLAKALQNAEQVIKEKTEAGQELQDEVDRLQALVNQHKEEHEEQCKVYEGRYKKAQADTEELLLKAQAEAKAIVDAANANFEKTMADAEAKAGELISAARDEIDGMKDERARAEQALAETLGIKDRTEKDLAEVQEKLAKAKKEVAGILNPEEPE